VSGDAGKNEVDSGGEFAEDPDRPEPGGGAEDQERANQRIPHESISLAG